jgi:hypothetical protein
LNRKSLVFSTLKLQKKCAEMYEGQDKTHLALAGSGISAQSLFSIRPQEGAGQSQHCNGPADRAVDRLHGCDLTAIHTIQRKMTSPMSAMNDTPTE